MKENLRLKNFPISFFSPVMGISGFSLALLKAESLTHLPRIVTLGSVYLSVALFAVIGLFYILKIFVFKEEVIKEFSHPININFFPLISTSFLVLSIIALTLNWSTAFAIWIVGVVLQSIFSLLIVRAWVLHDKFQIKHISPAWFLPVVGNLIIPIAGINYVEPEINWFFFTIGIFWMFILMNIILYRVIFHEPMPDKLLPTFFITFAAPAIGFIAYTKLTDGLDPFGYILYFMSLFLFILNLSITNAFVKIKFYISWWAYSFPLAAFILASMVFMHQTGIALFGLLSVITLVLLALLIIVIAFKTLRAMSHKEVCIED